MGFLEDPRIALNEALFGISCNRPVADAALQQGENVLYLGNGVGREANAVAEEIGPTGQVIGLHPSHDTISNCRDNAERRGQKPPHVAFVHRLHKDPLPIASDTMDCVIVNCATNTLTADWTINLFKEVYRVLKPGGRVVIDDVIAKQHLSDEAKEFFSCHLSYASGSVLLEQYIPLVQSAGFSAIESRDIGAIQKAYSLFWDPPEESGHWVHELNIPSLIAVYRIFTRKPPGPIPENAPANPLLRWTDAYPTPYSRPPAIAAEELAHLIKNKQPDFAVIDVRREDRVGGYVRGSDNCPAQTFYDDLPAFAEKYGNTEKVIFYCGGGTRGPRCAGWYQDYLNMAKEDPNGLKSKVYVLQDGAKGWLAKYGGDEELVEKV